MSMPLYTLPKDPDPGGEEERRGYEVREIRIEGDKVKRKEREGKGRRGKVKR